MQIAEVASVQINEKRKINNVQRMQTQPYQ